MLIFADGSSGERASREHVSKPLFQAPGAQEQKPEPDPAASAEADADLVLWDAIGASMKARWRPEAVGSSVLRGLGLRSITAERQKQLSLRRLAQSQSPQAPQVQGDAAGETTGDAAAKAQVVQEGIAGAAGDTGTMEQEGPLKFSEGKAEVEGGGGTTAEGEAISGGAGSGVAGGGGGDGGDETASHASSGRFARRTQGRPAALTMGSKEGGGSSPGSLSRANDVTSVHSSASGQTAKTTDSAALWRRNMGFEATTYGSEASETMSKATVKTTASARQWLSFFSRSPQQIAEGDGESTMSENASERDNRAFPEDDQDAAAPGGVSVKRDPV